MDGSLQKKDAQLTWGNEFTVSTNVHNKDTHAASVSSTGPLVINLIAAINFDNKM